MLLLDRPVEPAIGRRSMPLGEYLSLPEDFRAEIVDGVIRPMTRSDRVHRAIQRRLAAMLDSQAPADIEVMEEEVIVIHDEPAHARVPDVVVFVAKPDDDGRTNNTPARDVLLVVEIESPSTCRADRFEKPVEYAEAGIPSYWRIETQAHVVVRTYELVAGAYKPAGQFGRGESIRDATLDWVSVAVNDLVGRFTNAL